MTVVHAYADDQLDFDRTRVHVLPPSRQLTSLHTIARDRHASRDAFLLSAGRIIRQLLDTAINLLPFEPQQIETPVGEIYAGLRLARMVTGVSVIRAGESMEAALREIIPDVAIGKILIQRDKATAKPKFFYRNLPADIAKGDVLLLDPMLATGGTAVAAIDVLADAGVPQDHIILVTLIAAPEGIAHVLAERPKITIVTSAIEQRLNENSYMIPGIGDFGDRYFGTDAAPDRRSS